MKAIVLTRFGPPEVLQLEEVAKPIPKGNEVLIRVCATTVSIGECALRGLKVPVLLKLPMWIYVRFFRPKPIILGQEVAGEIEEAGKDVTRFKKGDYITGWCGLRLGANAEYACLRETGMLAIRPSNMTCEEASTLPIGGVDAAYLLRKADIQPGQKVLINGAGGSIGTYAVQIARYFGAEVTGVDSTGKLEMLRSIGADHVIDYTKEDFTRNGETYDVIFDVIGKSSLSRGVRMLTPNGRYVTASAGPVKQSRGRRISQRSSKVFISWASRTASEYAQEYKFLRELSEAGQIKAVIDKSYPLEQTADAHRYVETGQKKGHVVVTVGQENKP